METFHSGRCLVKSRKSDLGYLYYSSGSATQAWQYKSCCINLHLPYFRMDLFALNVFLFGSIVPGRFKKNFLTDETKMYFCQKHSCTHPSNCIYKKVVNTFLEGWRLKKCQHMQEFSQCLLIFIISPPKVLKMLRLKEKELAKVP